MISNLIIMVSIWAVGAYTMYQAATLSGTPIEKAILSSLGCLVLYVGCVFCDTAALKMRSDKEAE